MTSTNTKIVCWFRLVLLVYLASNLYIPNVSMGQNISMLGTVLYVIQYQHGQTPKSQAWQGKTIKPNNRWNMVHKAGNASP